MPDFAKIASKLFIKECQIIWEVAHRRRAPSCVDRAAAVAKAALDGARQVAATAKHQQQQCYLGGSRSSTDKRAGRGGGSSGRGGRGGGLTVFQAVD